MSARTSVAPEAKSQGVSPRMLTATLDTNCLIDLEEQRPSAEALQKLISFHEESRIELAVVAVSASERQPDYQFLPTYAEFRAKVDSVGLGQVPEILGLAYWGISYWGHTIWTSEESTALERMIHEAMFPTIEFNVEDFAARHNFAVEGADPGDLTSVGAEPFVTAKCFGHTGTQSAISS